MNSKQRGRPRVGIETVPVTVRMPTADYDRIYSAATSARVSLAEWIRRQTKSPRKSERSE